MSAKSIVVALTFASAAITSLYAMCFLIAFADVWWAVPTALLLAMNFVVCSGCSLASVAIGYLSHRSAR